MILNIYTYVCLLCFAFTTPHDEYKAKGNILVVVFIIQVAVEVSVFAIIHLNTRFIVSVRHRLAETDFLARQKNQNWEIVEIKYNRYGLLALYMTDIDIYYITNFRQDCS